MSLRDRFSGRGNLRLPTRFFTSFSAQVYDYTYDTAGNIRTVSKDGTVIQTYSYSNGDWKDQLVSVNGMSISYDGAGNPTSYPRFEDGVDYYMVWNQGRQLTYLDYATAADNETQIYYSYDADGIRTSKTVTKGTASTTTSYVTQNGKVVRETIGTGTTAKVLDFIYDANGRPFALKYTNGTAETELYYYVLNLQGDVVALMTENRSIVAKYSYNAWGELLSVTNGQDVVITDASHIAHVNPLRYRGYYYDAETGFYYLQSRYYDPVIHRFISADSVITGAEQSVQGYNLFEYCNNNPTSKLDNTGAWPKWVEKAASSIVNVTKKVASVVSNAVTSIESANHVQKMHVTTPTAMLDLGLLLGKIGFSSTVTKQNKELGLVHTASDIGNDANKYSAGINFFGWSGIDVGVSSEMNAFISTQATPWLHHEVSVGLDGIGTVIGFDVGDVSYDFEINGGWGTIAILFALRGLTTAGAPVMVPA